MSHSTETALGQYRPKILHEYVMTQEEILFIGTPAQYGPTVSVTENTT